MKNPFNAVPMNKPKRNHFDLSHERKQTQGMGTIIPCLVQEVIPGDTMTCNTEILVRFLAMLSPMMHRVDACIHYFYVPNRIVWDEWQDFITGGEDGTDLPSFPRCKMDAATKNYFNLGDIPDYMGIPPMDNHPANSSIEIGVLPFRALTLIYDEFYRDQNLIEESGFSRGSGIQDSAEIKIITKKRRRAWAKDYFTSALPFTQRGIEITLPLGLTAPIDWAPSGTQGTQAYDATSHILNVSTTDLIKTSGNVAEDVSQKSLKLDVSADHVVDLQQASSATVNQWREAIRIQRWLEISARAGSRYTEQIKAHFGVDVPDYRLQRPEFLGGGKTPITISEVLSTYQSEANANDAPVGQMFGHGVTFGEQNGFKAFFPEHGYVIGILTIMPKAGYMQGLHRTWFKFDKFDYYFPEFAHLGEQEVFNKELYFTTDHTKNEDTFGYQQRYAEYKHSQSQVCGEFRTTLDFWHLDRKFTDYPLLNDEFIECNPSERVFATTDGTDKVICSMYHKIQMERPIPFFSIPSISG